MKGPGLRIDLDVRRVWRCPKCGRIVRTAGQVTAQRCGCTSDAVQWMHLEPAVKKEPFRAPHRDHLPEVWEVAASAAAPAAQPERAELPAEVGHASESPASEPVLETMADVLDTGIVIAERVTIEASATEGPAPDSAIPPPDAFGAGVEDGPRNPDET